MSTNVEMSRLFALGGRGAKSSHTVTHHEHVSHYILFGHTIATLDHEHDVLRLYACDHQTVTTAKAMNAIIAAVPFARKWKLKSWVLTDPHGTKHEWVEGITIRADNAVPLEGPTSGLSPALGDR